MFFSYFDPIINEDSKLKMWNTSFNEGEVGNSGKVNMNFNTQLPFLDMWEIGTWWPIIRTGGSINQWSNLIPIQKKKSQRVGFILSTFTYSVTNESKQKKR